MEVMHDLVCGLDVHRDSISACILAAAPGGELREESTRVGTTYDDIIELAKWIKGLGSPNTAMESTGTYWTPIYNILTQEGIACIVVNARHARNVPGRKTDMNDARWIAQLTMHGLLQASVIPEPELQELRYYTRAYTKMVQDRAQVVNRIEKLMQRNGFKLSSVLEDILGQTGRAILNHLAEKGVVTEAVVAKCRSSRCKYSAEVIAKAMRGRMTKTMRWMLKFELEQIDHYDAQCKRLCEEIGTMLKPCAEEMELLCTIPGISQTSATQILAEIGSDMTVFKSGAQLAAWAGLTPGNNESAGKKSPRASNMETAT